MNNVYYTKTLSVLSTLHRYTFYCFIIRQHFSCFLLMCFKYLCPHTGTPTPLLLQIQPDLQPPHCQYLLSPVLPYPPGTVSPLRQDARSFLLRHRHNSVYQTAAFSLPEKVSLSALSLKTSSPHTPFLVHLQKYRTCWRIFSNFFLIPRNSATYLRQLSLSALPLLQSPLLLP